MILRPQFFVGPFLRYTAIITPSYKGDSMKDFMYNGGARIIYGADQM